MLKHLKESDHILYEMVQDELLRQRQGIEMIASESFVPYEILELQGSILTNKTMEGFPGRRYHAGHEVIDRIETLAIERAKALYRAEHAVVQPHSGSQANHSVYQALIKPGDTILGMRLDHGGHLSHGSSVNLSGKIYKSVFYGLNPETETIDYRDLEAKALEHRPRIIIAGASAYPRFIDYERIAAIARGVEAYFLVDMAHIAGLVAAGVHPTPVPFADVVTGTTTKNLGGARGGFILSRGEYAAKLDKATFPGVQGSMHMHIMGAKAFTFMRAGTDEFKGVMTQVVKNARTLGEALKDRGFRLVTGGTDNHLLLVDLRPKGLTGEKLEKALERVGITVNKNMIPNDPEKPMVTSGVRIGVTAMTMKGALEGDMQKIAGLIDEVARHPQDETVLDRIAAEAREIALKFPLYPGIEEE
ncbi:MAG: serine hydroxymethyltransferase [delta proteobacterium ML8_F1]|nr:MAG: serine hydroxymethyltransferase [delta proteobacterium ML8_F1]